MTPREARKNLMLAATIEAGAVSAPVRIRNLSEGGAMIDGPALPERGSTVVLNRLELAMPATVIWNQSGRCGLRLDGRIVIDEWISGVRQTAKDGSLGQLRVDKIQQALRSGAALPFEAETPKQPDPAHETVDDHVIDDRIASELAHVKQMLDAVADELTEDIDIITRHERALQNFDIASMIVQHLGEIMAAEDQAAAVARIPMHDLRSRLSAIPTLK